MAALGPVLPDGDGLWRTLRADALRHGHAVCHARLADWTSASDRRLRELLASRRLLRHVLARVGDTDPAAVVVERSRFGRPLVRRPAGLDAGVSHTRGLLVAGVAGGGGRIGVDVEALDRPMLLPGMPERMCHPEEYADLRRRPAASRNRHLVRLWTLKEAYAKALGVGLRLEFSGIGFVRGPGDVWHSPQAPGWCFRVSTVAGRFAVARAVGPP